jgi:hypothetical protein
MFGKKVVDDSLRIVLKIAEEISGQMKCQYGIAFYTFLDKLSFGRVFPFIITLVRPTGSRTRFAF